MVGWRRRNPDTSTVLGDLRQAIARLDEQRRLAAAAAGRALVTRAEVTRACTEQLQALAAAGAVAEDAETKARAAARGAHAAGDGSADGYERTGDALSTSQAVLGAAAEPIHALLADAERNAEKARAVLAKARRTLDAQLRDQVRMLREFERWEQQRQIAIARRRGGG